MQKRVEVLLKRNNLMSSLRTKYNHGMKDECEIMDYDKQKTIIKQRHWVCDR